MTWDELRAAWPHLHFWEGVSGLLYVRRPMSSPAWVKRGASVEDLRREIEADPRH